MTLVIFLQTSTLYFRRMNQQLASKYNLPVPRYTSYPTVPNWNDTIDKHQWMELFKSRFDEENHVDGVSIYIHLPFCESLCTYCGCNRKITTNHSVESEYIEALEKEWLLYKKMMVQTPVIRELHLGGGTPTFFSPEMLERIVKLIAKGSIRHPKYEFSFEGHPNNTTSGHLETLARLGFRRVSYGVQDNDPEVQRVINRIQPLENVRKASDNARSAGFTSVNFDLIYGLPLQSVSSIEKTMNAVLPLRPDRIAFYSYAHIPWTSRSQRLFNESHLPSVEEKLAIHDKGVELMSKAGYEEIGMDHYALPDDELFVAMKSGRLHRNFMGYTSLRSGILIGLGVSSIGDTGNSFAQNEKSLHDYYEAINHGQLAVKKGYFLTDLDCEIRKHILNISCNGETRLQGRYRDILEEYALPKLREMADDGLVHLDENNVKVTAMGRKFIRNICSAFDLFLEPSDNKQIFSKAI